MVCGIERTRNKNASLEFVEIHSQAQILHQQAESETWLEMLRCCVCSSSSNLFSLPFPILSSRAAFFPPFSID